MVGVQVDASTLSFTSPQWPLMLAFGLAGLGPLLPPLRIAEDWLRQRAYRAVGIPVRVRQTTRALIATMDRCAVLRDPDTERSDATDALEASLLGRVEAFRVLFNSCWIGQDMAARKTHFDSVLRVLAELDLLVSWGTGTRGAWPVSASDAVRKIEKDLVQGADRLIDDLIRMLRSAGPDAPKTNKRDMDADITKKLADAETFRDELVAVLAIYAEHDPLYNNQSPRAGEAAIAAEDLKQLLRATDPPDAVGSGPEFPVLICILPVFLLYAVFAFKGWHPLVAPHALAKDPFVILMTAWIETLRLMAIIWLPLLAAFSFRQFLAENGTWIWKPAGDQRSRWLEQRLALLGIALTVAILGLIGVACLRAFAMADSRGRFIDLLTGGQLPFILFYLSMAVAAIPLIFAAPAAADARARGDSVTWAGVRCALATAALLMIHTTAWYGAITSCIPDHVFLTDMLMGGCFLFYGALDFLLYGALAFLAVAVFGTPARLRAPTDAGTDQATPAEGPAAAKAAPAVLLAGLAALLLSAGHGAAQPSAPRPAAPLGTPEASGEVWRRWPYDYDNVVKVGFRSDVEPFSYEAAPATVPGKPVYAGYLADLCHAIFAGSTYVVKEIPVSAADDRFDMLQTGLIDVLCDPVTMRYSDERRWQSGIFSPIVFASGISYLRKTSREPGRATYVGYVEGTTSVPLALRSCEVDLFNVIPADERGLIRDRPGAAAARQDRREPAGRPGLDRSQDRQ